MSIMDVREPLAAAALGRYPTPDREAVDAALGRALAAMDRKIVVLDDDPTGVQTVHDVSVYTGWGPEAVRAGFDEPGGIFFILTNSRGFTAAETREAHRAIARRVARAAAETGKEFLLISRSDSTLRGHYPLETQTLRETLEAETGQPFDGEVLCPFFQEGGRFTIGGVHYVREGETLVPAGATEFAGDKTFGYRASHLGLWCEEKTGGAYRAQDMTYITMEELRALDYEGIERKLLAVTGFQKVIVDAVDYVDVKVFATAFARAVARGKRFLLRTAAAVTKVLGRVPDQPLLTRAQLVCENGLGGAILVGSHVNKTTRQLEALLSSGLPLEGIEFNQHLVLAPGRLERELARVVAEAEAAIRAGRTAVIYTRRDRLDLPGGSPDDQLRVSVQISDAVTGIIGRLSVQPSFLIAKGGITSSDVGTKALRVKRALVLGQVAPGIPVWRTGPESKFPNMPYVIFPGNVGEDVTLRDVTGLLIGGGNP